MKKMRFYFSILLLVVFSGVSCKKDEAEHIIERGIVSDVEGRQYETVKIGDKWWMAENLRTSRFNDGSMISFLPVVDGYDTSWAQINGPAYCYIDSSLFGYLYNAYVLTSGKEIAPAGWHVASEKDWQELERTLGMESSEIIESGWRGTNEANLITSKYNRGWGANDQDNGLYGSDYFGFNALPSGVRAHDGRTNIQNNSAFWWSSDSLGGDYVYRSIDIKHQRIFRYTAYKPYGMSIRCVKD